MNIQRPKLGPGELEVFNRLCEYESQSVKDLHAHFSTHSGWARTTIQTILERLRKKGYIERRETNGKLHYFPLCMRESVLASKVQDFIETTLNGSLKPFVQFIETNQNLSKDEIEQLQKILSRMP